MKKLTILGSTGSVGINTLSVILKNSNLFSVKALVGNLNVKLMLKQCKLFNPSYVAMYDKNSANLLSKELKFINSKIKVFSGMRSICELSALDEVDQVICAISGSSGLLPIFSAIQAGKKILLANKESLIIAGNLFMKAVKNYKAKILPIDSEHSAIFQSLPFHIQKNFSNINLFKNGIKKIILTGSGGPFLNLPLKKLKYVTPQQACFHPVWSMGKKISVDSATMINKGFEYIEASFLFNASNNELEILLHPQATIHSMVEYYDGSTIAHFGFPDMKISIAYAMGWPKRILSGVSPINFCNIQSLAFFKPDFNRYPCLKLALEAFQESQVAIISLNAANEAAVFAFLNSKIKFTDIVKINEKVLELFSCKEPNDIESVIEINKKANIFAHKIISGFIKN